MGVIKIKEKEQISVDIQKVGKRFGQRALLECWENSDITDFTHIKMRIHKYITHSEWPFSTQNH